MKKKEKTVCQIIRFRGNIDTFLVSIEKFARFTTSAFTFKTLLRHYAKQALTPRSLNVKLGPRRNYHKGQAAIRHYANQPAVPFDFCVADPISR